ncbi:RISC-loading complex subunit TARBP2-like [Anoplolepis gracilipes]|uniref:RISC-loading complex subunit TARBP2-like n=1 Tax=Anoplolepis gracilipes TaxID=354296 RepID=UPI003BA1434A
MNKSPISLLQELSVKQGYVPKYDCIGLKVEGAYNRFVYRVKCKDFVAEGVGNSKKDAKQDAAEKMLSLLANKNEISLQSPVANKIGISIPIKFYEPTSLSRMKTESSPDNINYVGLLQEFCMEQKLTFQDINYEVVEQSGPPHMKVFTIEVRIGTACEKGSAQCKKAAKQEAAKRLLQRLHPDINKLSKGKKNEAISTETAEDGIRKLGIGITDYVISKPVLPVESLSKRAEAMYMKCTDKELTVTKQNFLLKDIHNLFNKTYSSKISYTMRKKMQSVRDIYINHADMIKEVIQELVSTLGVKMEKKSLINSSKNYIIYLRLSSIPNITQLGIGETKDAAEIQAMYNIIETILTFLNIF